MAEFRHLFQPIRIGTLELKNRIVMCPMGTCFATEEGMATEQMANYYAERAKGGTGLIIVEQVVVQPRGKWSLHAGGMWDDKFIPGWKMVVDAVHAHDGKIAIELGHLGASTSSQLTGYPTWSPSPLPDYLTRETPHEMTRDDIRQFIDDYVAAVRRSVKAGFDAIEIHATHGYLMASFLSGRTNRRTDEYGGTLEGRLRLLQEIIREVRKEAGPRYPLLMRIASVEPNGGRLLEETKVVAKALVEEGLDAIDVSAGAYFDFEWEVPPYLFSHGFNISATEAIKNSVNVPVIVAMRITEPRMAEQILAEDRADMIGLGRGLIADPDWPNKVAEGKLDQVRRCIGCVRCIEELTLGWVESLHAEAAGQLRCTVNPFVGREGQVKTSKASKRKKVLMIGGGPAGLYATAIAASRGHDVTLWEKEQMLGGQVRIAAMPPLKYEMGSIITWLANEARLSGGKLETGKEATVDNILAFKPDVVIIATGATALVPDIPGIDRPNVVSAHDLLIGKAAVGEKVLVAGGGLIGCETAHFLTTYDKDVTIVEMLDGIGKDLPMLVRPMLLRILKAHNVKMYTSAKIREILADGVVVERDGKQEALRGYDNVVIAMGARSENQLYEKIRGKVAEVYCIGDATKPRKVLEALNDGLDVGLKI